MFDRAIALAVLLAAGCAASSHPTRPATLGRPWSSTGLEAVIEQPGPVEVQTLVGADWEVPREGLIDLDHPTAKAAGLTDRPEPIQIFVHVLRHPTRGVFLVDSGVSRKLIDDPAGAGVGWVIRQMMHTERMKIGVDTASLIRQLGQPLAGVLLTHLHLDHITGMPDVPAGTPVYAGPGETGERGFFNLFSNGTVDGLMDAQQPLQEWTYRPDPDGRFAGVVDVFGDGSVAALWMPGHTAGNTAYLVRTPRGPVLLAGDTCHTRWGWDHQVPPGNFSSDRPRSAVSLAALHALTTRHPTIEVRLGHQR